ncbi:MAG: DEAD/DEAH box helicase [Candidatus Thermoplasmatota archaeon]|nr:DEAD/DEAH box helicase [Candidatus Thermoplasmatota archaeon]
MEIIKSYYFSGKDVGLYEHQQRSIDEIEQGRSVLVSVPTASGKSLIAYYSIIRAAKMGLKSMYICPLKALAREKYEELREIGKGLFNVVLSIGDLDAGTDIVNRFDVIVCTSEKADSLMHHNPDYFNEIAVLVIDEIHNIGDQTRGPTLEILCTTARIVNPDIQIVALSATLQNAPQIGQWLNASVVKSDFRPVPLEKFVIFRDKLLNDEFGQVDTLKMGIYELIKKILFDGGQVLLFLNTRKRAEKFASDISEQMDERMFPGDIEVISENGDRNAESINRMAKRGVAFHHAGLNSSVRTFVEENFKSGRLKVITATPTLAAGINLPARAVIIRDLTRFSDGYSSYISNMEIEQMLGRAGRPKYDTSGEAYIFCPSQGAVDKVKDFFEKGVEPVESAMGKEKIVRFNTLALISNHFCTTIDSLYSFFDSTLYTSQNGEGTLKDYVDQVISYLENYGFIKTKGQILSSEKLGTITANLYIDPETAKILVDMFEETQEDISVPRLLYNICKTPDIFTLFPNRDDYALLSDFFDEISETPEDEDDIAAGKTALMLLDWINEVPIYEIEEKFSVGAGDIESRKSSAEWISMAASRLAAEFRRELSYPLDILSLRLKEGIRDDIMALISLPGIGRVRARRLYENGFKKPSDIANATVQSIAVLRGFSKTMAENVIKSSKAAGGSTE